MEASRRRSGESWSGTPMKNHMLVTRTIRTRYCVRPWTRCRAFIKHDAPAQKRSEKTSKPCATRASRVTRDARSQMLQSAKAKNETALPSLDYSNDWHLWDASLSKSPFAEIEARFYYEFARESPTILRLAGQLCHFSWGELVRGGRLALCRLRSALAILHPSCATIAIELVRQSRRNARPTLAKSPISSRWLLAGRIYRPITEKVSSRLSRRKTEHSGN